MRMRGESAQTVNHCQRWRTRSSRSSNFTRSITTDLDEEFLPEAGQTNPFLHMGLHLGLREQVATDRPQGIATIFSTLASKLGDPHDAEHRMIECLAETLWEAQRDGRPPDEVLYLERLRRIA